MKSIIRPLYGALLPVLFTITIANAQPAMRAAERVAAAKTTGQAFTRLEAGPRTALPTGFPLPVQQLVRQYQVFTVTPAFIKALDDKGDSPVELALPLDESKQVSLELVPVNNLAPGFTATTNTGEKILPGRLRTYQGIIKGDPTSVAAITILDDEVAGFFSNSSGNYIVGRLQAPGRDNYNIVYKESELRVRPDIGCGMTDTQQGLPAMPFIDVAAASSLARTSRCVRLYFETEYDIYQTLNSNTTNVQFYIAVLFNQIKTLYNNDGIAVSLGGTLVWTATDPYTAATASANLTQFQAYRTSINGDIGQLITFRNLGGGWAAGFSGICNPNTAQKLCVSGNLTTTFPGFPAYSGAVAVTTHEFGHLLGSRHTHACVWNNNYTAIDGCGPTYSSLYVEGSCPTGPIPAAGGTIMSYCHLLSTGINFHLGFGLQPAYLIRYFIENGVCLGSCEAAPACNSGVPPLSNVIAIKAVANGLWVSADNLGSNPLIASRSVVNDWEKFIVNDGGDGYIALKARVNYKYVTANNAGVAPLIASRDAIGPWEQFCWIDNGDGTFSLRSNANGLYVCADNGGVSPLIANRSSIGPWEKFTWVATTARTTEAMAAKGNVEQAAPAAIAKPIAYPNPAKFIVHVAFEAAKACNTTLVITSLDGHELLRQHIPAVVGPNNFAVALKGFAGGLYLLKLQSAGGQTVLKLSVQ